MHRYREIRGNDPDPARENQERKKLALWATLRVWRRRIEFFAFRFRIRGSESSAEPRKSGDVLSQLDVNPAA